MCPGVTVRGGGHKKTDHVFHSSSASVHWIMTPIIYLLDSPPCLHAPSIRKAAGLCFKGLTGKWEREENLSWSYSNLLLLLDVWSERSDVLTTLLPSAEPRLQSCTTLLSSAELNCQSLMAKMFPAQPNLLKVGISKKILFVFLRNPAPACPALMWSISCPENITGSFTDLATLKQMDFFRTCC